MRQHFAAASADIAEGLADWRMWLLLGMNDIRQRYRRSKLGQFWITLAMATTIVSMGILYAYLFKNSIKDFLPYLGASFVAWGLISSVVLDSCTVFIGAEGYVRQVPMPKSVFVHRMLVRNIVIFLHNLLILPPLFIIFGTPMTWALPLAFIGVALVLLNGIWASLLFGTLCARFRDMPQIIGSLMQVIFYMTPIMWETRQLPPSLVWLSKFNPFRSFLDLIREPMLGNVPAASSWEMVGAVTVLGSIAAAFCFARFRARIVYWL
jgi:ABC-type polysaccharide/polyol phosphate export permease